LEGVFSLRAAALQIRKVSAPRVQFFLPLRLSVSAGEFPFGCGSAALSLSGKIPFRPRLRGAMALPLCVRLLSNSAHAFPVASALMPRRPEPPRTPRSR
jgi:hypothetical protein